jgi:hypothetical protein
MAVKLHASAPKRARFKKICSESGIKEYGWSLDMPTRWNSTYEFLSTGLKMKLAIQKMCIEDKDLEQYQIDKTGWERIAGVSSFLKEFADVTSFMSKSTCNTFSHMYPLYNRLIDKLQKYRDQNKDQTKLFTASKQCLNKLMEYYGYTDANSLYVPAIGNSFINTVLNPCYKLAKLTKMGFTEDEVKTYRDEFTELFIVISIFNLEIHN